MVYSLFYSMTDCQGKDSASFFNLLQYWTVWLSKLISIVLLLGMIPVGRAQQTNHSVAPALTQGERRGWLLWTNKSKTPPPKTTRRSFLLLNRHSPTRMLDEWTNIMSGSVVKLHHSAPVRRHFLRLHKNKAKLLQIWSWRLRSSDHRGGGAELRPCTHVTQLLIKTFHSLFRSSPDWTPEFLVWLMSDLRDLWPILEPATRGQ